jgi:hypothetical protein
LVFSIDSYIGFLFMYSSFGCMVIISQIETRGLNIRTIISVSATALTLLTAVVSGTLIGYDDLDQDGNYTLVLSEGEYRTNIAPLRGNSQGLLVLEPMTHRVSVVNWGQIVELIREPDVEQRP